jgi:apolipoprotein D and lipocalin family protein
MRGYVVPGTGNARWRESPLWPIYLSYLILYVDPDYKTALVGYPGRGYGWVLSRSASMDEATYQSLLQRFAEQGYDISMFQRVPQGR